MKRSCKALEGFFIVTEMEKLNFLFDKICKFSLLASVMEKPLKIWLKSWRKKNYREHHKPSFQFIYFGSTISLFSNFPSFLPSFQVMLTKALKYSLHFFVMHMKRSKMFPRIYCGASTWKDERANRRWERD